IGHLRFRLNASIARCRPHGPASFLKVSRYSTSRSSTIALTSPERRKAARIPGRPTRISLRSIRATGSRLLLQCFELVDQALDHRQAALPEARIASVEPERLEQLGMVLGAPGRKHFEIARRKARLRALVDRIERVHQAIAERVGVDVERRVDEVRDI